MYAIIDWTTFSFVRDQETGMIRMWETRYAARKYAKRELNNGAWQAILVPI